MGMCSIGSETKLLDSVLRKEYSQRNHEAIRDGEFFVTERYLNSASVYLVSRVILYLLNSLIVVFQVSICTGQENIFHAKSRSADVQVKNVECFCRLVSETRELGYTQTSL